MDKNTQQLEEGIRKLIRKLLHRQDSETGDDKSYGLNNKEDVDKFIADLKRASSKKKN